jgi:hypothetical protein
LSARGLGHEKPTAGQSTAGRHGEVSFEMTAQDILSLAVNVAQNDWTLDALGCGATKNEGVVRVMLDEVYGQVLEANRRAVARRMAKRVP